MAYNANLYMPYGQQSFPQPAPWQQAAPQFQAQPLPFQPAQPQALNGDLVIKVYGRQGAEALPLGPNSKAVAVDRDEDVIYYIQTDDAANKDVQEFDFLPRKREEAEPDAIAAMQAQIAALAEKVEALSAQKPARAAARKAATDGE